MLTDFKEAKIPTKIDQGTIWITEETIPVKKGEAVPEKIAALLTKLDIMLHSCEKEKAGSGMHTWSWSCPQSKHQVGNTGPSTRIA